LNLQPSTIPRFILGIDLGTTNCALAFVDTKAGSRVEHFPVEQEVAAGVRERRDTLPSFILIEPDKGTHTTGWRAREDGMLTPGRMVSSAKSWLCHAGVDRRSPILPWHAANDVETLSPVEAQTRILHHLREAWDAAHPDHPADQQEVYITIPASFDEVARALTVQAAQAAGFPAPVLLEEPQAAFYAWLSRHEENWPQIIGADDYILICDIGGGTTDLTLIHARPAPDGTVNFHRTAVGEHLLLGGDNLDLALAHQLEARLANGGKLDARSWTTLVRQCRHYKETLLVEKPPESITVTLAAGGSGILSGQRQTTLTRAEAETWLLDGFLPLVDFASSPSRRASGFQEFGLPYAADPAISRYVAEFLRAHLPENSDGGHVAPKAVLLNGGLFESVHMRERFARLMRNWFVPEEPIALDHRRLDLAVALGAAYFGRVRRGDGVRVISDLARSYYIGLEGAGAQALCIAPAGLAAGEKLVIDRHPLRVMLKTPVSFPVYVSSLRTTDAAGDLVELDEESARPLPPIRTVLKAGKQATQTEIEVALEAGLSEIGTLELAIREKGGDRAWKLAFDLRAATRTDLSFHQSDREAGGFVEETKLAAGHDALSVYFNQSAATIAHGPVFKQLERIMEAPRDQWPVSALRVWWEHLHQLQAMRTRSAAHEQRWLNLAGYFLRPGFGLAIDDWRVGEMWKLFHAGPVHRTNTAVWSEWWIFWRRIAGGLTAGQQASLGQPLVNALIQLLEGKPRAKLPGGREIRLAEHEVREVLRLAALLERLPLDQRKRLGEALIRHIADTKPGRAGGESRIWALGRLAARVPVYGPIHAVIPPDIATGWIRQLIVCPHAARETDFALMLMTRKTGDRYRDIEDMTLRNEVAKRFITNEAPAHWQTLLVEEGSELEGGEMSESIGESIPLGLKLA
jgi:hypothetical protein